MNQPPEAAEVRPVERSLNGTIESLRKTLGSAPRPVPDTIDTKENAARRAEILKGGFDDANEVYEYGALRLEQQRSQMLKELAAGKPVDLDALTAVGQGEAYHEYLPLLLQELQKSMDEYKALRSTVPSAVLASPRVARNEVTGEMFLAFLDEALKERTEFGSAVLLAQCLRYGVTYDGTPIPQGEEGEKIRADYHKRLDATIASGTLRKDAVDALRADDEKALLEHANQLNQRVLDVLSGRRLAVEMAEVSFHPQAMALELLTSAYENVLEREKEIVSDPRNSAAESEIRTLLAEAEEAGKTLPKDKLDRLRSLRDQQRDRQAALKKLRDERHRYVEELLRHTDALGRFQIRAEELTAIQRQFGRAIDPLAGPSSKQEIPDEVRKGIDRNMEERKKFHLDRIDAFLGTLEKDDGVLSIGAGEMFEDFNNKQLRPITLAVTQTLAGIASFPVPEAFGLKKRLRNAIAGDLEDAMDIPKYPDGTPKPEKEWTADERAAVEKKAKGVLDAINEFTYEHNIVDGETVFERDGQGKLIEKPHLRKLHETLDALRAMPSAKEFVGKPMGPMPTERVTAGNVGALIAKHGGPAVYAKLLDQLLEDWGSVDGQPPSGVIGESGEMMRKIDDVVGVHIDVAEAEVQLATDIADWLLYALYALGAYVALDVAYKIKKLFSRGGPSKKEVKALREELKNLTDQRNSLHTENEQLRSRLKTNEHLIDLEDAGSPTLEAGDIKPSAKTDTASIHGAKADVNTAVRGDATVDENVKTNPKTDVKAKK